MHECGYYVSQQCSIFDLFLDLRGLMGFHLESEMGTKQHSTTLVPKHQSDKWTILAGAK